MANALAKTAPLKCAHLCMQRVQNELVEICEKDGNEKDEIIDKLKECRFTLGEMILNEHPPDPLPHLGGRQYNASRSCVGFIEVVKRACAGLSRPPSRDDNEWLDILQYDNMTEPDTSLGDLVISALSVKCLMATLSTGLESPPPRDIWDMIGETIPPVSPTTIPIGYSSIDRGPIRCTAVLDGPIGALFLVTGGGWLHMVTPSEREVLKGDIIGSHRLEDILSIGGFEDQLGLKVTLRNRGGIVDDRIIFRFKNIQKRETARVYLEHLWYSSVYKMARAAILAITI
eukprot:GHVO01044843.1.p1 GENE.GHVO01044843.1~~GHVO01044843.1.p1  ORF type:complete len:303 (+),score=60.88 GHVO01044843.1:49-909(+)